MNENNTKIVVTIAGKDGIGIVAEISSLLAKYQVNIEDIRQTIMQGCFMMFLLGDISTSTYSFKEIKDALAESGKKLGMEIWTQKKEIFDKMHTI
ncbi:ACT domain-containing protein [bacterium]|nr:ACT domain-containing protein [bacterium]